MLFALSRRGGVRAPCRALHTSIARRGGHGGRQLDGSFYDSQSGRWVSLTGRLKLRDLADEAANGEAVNLTIDHNRTKVVVITQAAKARGERVVVTVANAFALDPEDVVVVCLKIADAGADAVVLSDCSGVADEESLSELVEMVLYEDVEGMPMSYRLGLRAPPTEAGLALYRAALENHSLKYLDVDGRVDGEAPRVAPSRSDVVALAEELEVELDDVVRR